MIPRVVVLPEPARHTRGAGRGTRRTRAVTRNTYEFRVKAKKRIRTMNTELAFIDGCLTCDIFVLDL